MSSFLIRFKTEKCKKGYADESSSPVVIHCTKMRMMLSNLNTELNEGIKNTVKQPVSLPERFLACR
jgi:hypothetical protein